MASRIGIQAEPSSTFDQRLRPVARSEQFTTRSRIDFPLGLVLVGLNILFFTQILLSMRILESVRLIVPIGYLLLIAGGGLRAIETRGGPLRSVRFYRNWFMLFILVVIIMVGRSLLEGASPSTIYLTALPYLLFIMVFIGQSKTDWFWLNRVLIFHAVVGSILGVMAITNLDNSLYFTNLYQARDYILSNPVGSVIDVGQYALVFLIASYPRQSRVVKITTLVGLILTVLSAILGQFKSGFITPVGALALSFIALRRQGQKISWRKLLIPIAALLFFYIALFQYNFTFGSNLLASARNGLIARTTASASGLFGMQDRWDEARFAAQDLQPFDWIFGRGVAGTWDSTAYTTYYYMKTGEFTGYGQARGMTHFGPMFLVLKGGIPLLVLFLIFPFGVAWKRLFTSRDQLTLAASVVSALYFVGFIGGAFPQASLWYVVVMLCAGRCAAGGVQIKNEAFRPKRPVV